MLMSFLGSPERTTSRSDAKVDEGNSAESTQWHNFFMDQCIHEQLLQVKPEIHTPALDDYTLHFTYIVKVRPHLLRNAHDGKV